MNRWQQRAQELAHENSVNARILHHKVERVTFSCLQFLNKWGNVQRTIEQNPQALAGALKSAEAQTNAADGPSWDAVLADVTKVADEIRQVGHHPAAGTPSHLHHARPMLRV